MAWRRWEFARLATSRRVSIRQLELHKLETLNQGPAQTEDDSRAMASFGMTPLQEDARFGAPYDTISPEEELSGERAGRGSWKRGENWELTKLVGVAATTAATLGYDVGIMAAAIQPIEARFTLSGFQKELVMGSLNFVAAVGALLGGAVADKYGRKKTVSLTCWLLLVGTICLAMAHNYSLLLAGRIIMGMGVGVAFVVAPVFISEVAPTDKRGELNTVFDVAINGGILLGYVVGYLIQVTVEKGYKWRVMLGVGGVFPCVVLALLSSLPESPRWLMLVDQKPAATAVLRRLGSTQEESEETISAIEKEFQSEQNQTNPQMWSRGQRLAVKLGFWQQISGTETVLYYSADFLARAGLQSPSKRLLGNIFVGVSKLIPEVMAMRYVDVIGRRPLLILSSVSLMSTIGLLSMAFWLGWSANVVVILLCSVMASFSIGVGPFTFLCASENLASRERATGMTYCASANRCTSGLVALTAVSLSDLMGDDGLFALYAAFAVGALVFYSTVPETSGHTLEELAAARTRESLFAAEESGEEFNSQKRDV